MFDVVHPRDTQWYWVITFFERPALSSRAGNLADEFDDSQ